MTNINCKATKCGYNSCEKCLKSQIDVEGLYAKSKVGTFCQSYNLNRREAEYNFIRPY